MYVSQFELIFIKYIMISIINNSIFAQKMSDKKILRKKPCIIDQLLSKSTFRMTTKVEHLHCKIYKHNFYYLCVTSTKNSSI